MGRILSIDYGQKKIGLAVTDPLQIIPNGLDTVHVSEIHQYIKDYCAKEDVEYFVVGWPLNLDGEAAQSMQYVEPFVNWLRKNFKDKKVVLVDERFSSVRAHEAMLAGGLKKKQRQDKKLVDKISATIILQDHLETIKGY